MFLRSRRHGNACKGFLEAVREKGRGKRVPLLHAFIGSDLMNIAFPVSASIPTVPCVEELGETSQFRPAAAERLKA